MLTGIGQVTGEEKYEVFISNVVMIWSSSSVGIV